MVLVCHPCRGWWSLSPVLGPHYALINNDEDGGGFGFWNAHEDLLSSWKPQPMLVQFSDPQEGPAGLWFRWISDRMDSNTMFGMECFSTKLNTYLGLGIAASPLLEGCRWMVIRFSFLSLHSSFHAILIF